MRFFGLNLRDHRSNARQNTIDVGSPKWYYTPIQKLTARTRQEFPVPKRKLIFSNPSCFYVVTLDCLIVIQVFEFEFVIPKAATKGGTRMMFGQEMKVKPQPAKTVVKAFPASQLKSQIWGHLECW